MRFHVLGLGSIGSLLSHHLRRTLPSTHTVTLIHRKHQYVLQAHKNGGIRVERNGVTSLSTGFMLENTESTYRTFQTTLEPHLSASEEGQGDPSKRIDSLFVTTKAHHTVQAIRSILPRLAPHCTIVLLQNGMGIYEELVQSLFQNRFARPHFILASNTHGAFTKSRLNIVHTGVGEIQFGIVPDPLGRDFEAGFFDSSIHPSERRARLSDIAVPSDPSFERYQSLRNTVAAMLLLEPLHTSWLPMEEIQTAMRRKLVVNSIVNPLTAILNCKNGDVFTSPSSLWILRRVCKEASSVFVAQLEAALRASEKGAPSREVDVSERLGQCPPALTPSSLESECLRVARITSENISSMLSDVRLGRETEIHSLNGYLVKMARAHNIKVPVTETLAQLVNMRSGVPLDQSF